MTWTRAILLILPLCVNAYFLDESCEAVINGVDVKESVRFAMELARGAQNEIDSAEDKNIKELRSWLFPDDELDLADNKKIYERVQLFETLDQPSTDDVPQPTIYCDLSRWKEVSAIGDDGKKVTKLQNTKTRKTFRDDAHMKSYEKCKNGDKTLAFTTYFGKGMLDMQLCPWFLDKLRNRETPAPVNMIGGLPERPENGPTYDPMDDFREPETPDTMVLVELLDSVLLHEFTHALSEKYDSTDDFAYYWDRCVADGFQAKGCFNANSYSFFAVGVHLINRYEMKWNKKGYVVALDAATTKRGMDHLVRRQWAV